MAGNHRWAPWLGTMAVRLPGRLLFKSVVRHVQDDELQASAPCNSVDGDLLALLPVEPGASAFALHSVKALLEELDESLC